ncbi:MAG: DUF1905 domain-containing protein [Sphingomonadales bacterium]|nr:DUF1905 domain-containing protein [Sphingomonadales bacterium]
MAQSRTFRCTLTDEGAIPVPFDPREAFGKVRAPVVVTLGDYSYRSTIAAMGGPYFVPLRQSHREAARVAAGDTLTVTLALDTAPRRVEAPDDLKAALAAANAWEAWSKLSYTHQREHVEAIVSAKKAETRERRVAKAVAMVVAAA